MDIKIRQSFHKKEQRNLLDHAFIPMDNTTNQNPELREYRFFLDHYNQGLHKKADYTGIVSWKFNQKTRTEGRTFIDYIKNNPGYNVYFINPYPHETYLFKNVWLQGEACHPGLIEFVQSVMVRLNYDIDLMGIETSHDTALYCNFWVGDAYFWDEYMRFTQPIFQHLLTNLSDEEKRFINQPADKARDATATYVSFIMERLFSTLLVYHKNIKALAYAYPCLELQIIQTLYDNHREAIKRIQRSQQSSTPLEVVRDNPEARIISESGKPRISKFPFWRKLIKKVIPF